MVEEEQRTKKKEKRKKKSHNSLLLPKNPQKDIVARIGPSINAAKDVKTFHNFKIVNITAPKNEVKPLFNFKPMGTFKKNKKISMNTSV